MRSVSVPRAVTMMIGTPLRGAARGRRRGRRRRAGAGRAGPGRACAVDLARLGDRGGDHRLEALARQRLRERLEDRRLVLDEQDARTGHGAPSVIARRAGAEKLCQGFARGCRGVGCAVPMLHPMNDRLRTRIAAGGTISALGVLAAVALAAGSGGTPEPASQTTGTTAPEVRTEVERRTVTADERGDHRGEPGACAGPRSRSRSRGGRAAGHRDHGRSPRPRARWRRRPRR